VSATLGGVRISGEWNLGTIRPFPNVTRTAQVRKGALKIHLVHIDPPQFQHGAVFDELITLYGGILGDLGHEVDLSKNRLAADRLNVVFGWHFLPQPPPAGRFRYVVCQTEILGFDAGWYCNREAHFHSTGLPVLRNAAQIWDYSPDNIGFLSGFGLTPRYIPLGYHPSLTRIRHREVKDIDVLFYGSTSQRRFEVVKRLERLCHTKGLFGAYGEARDEWIGRSRLVLNIHYHENAPIMEQVRVSYLLANRSFVVSESCSANPYAAAVVEYPYPELIEGVMDWLGKDEEREAIAAHGLDVLMGLDMPARVAAALDELA
jgi:hypothetical protein